MIEISPPSKKSGKNFTTRLESVDEFDRVETVGEMFVDRPRVSCLGVSVHYGDKQALFNIDLDLGRNEVLALIGPSGCGKTTFLRCINRMNDTIEGCRVDGEIKIDGAEINHSNADVVSLAQKWVWFFRSPIRFQNLSLTISLMGLVFTPCLDLKMN